MKSEPKGLVSIERVVAFVVGPFVTVAFGWAASWLAQNVPGAPAIPAEAPTYVGGAISLAVAALVWKWLHGRQLGDWIKAGSSTLPRLAPVVPVSSGTAAIGASVGEFVEVEPGLPPIPPAEGDPAPSSAAVPLEAAPGQ